ncbi:MAG: ABC transporter permease [Anaerolineales bacterium]|nr:ABC transporter permease [Anaerolineales bacterium]
MLHLISMAWRDLGRNRRRSFFSALALAIALALLLFMASVVQGEMRDAMNASIRLESGHLQVRSANYNPDKTSLKWEDLIAAPATVASQIATLPQVEAATPRLYASGILASGETTVGVRVIGIDPASPANAPLTDGLLAGTFPTADDRDGVLIGQPLADKLKVGVGDRINLVINTSSGAVDEQNFVVRGIFSTRTPNYDEGNLFLPLAKAQAITGAEDRASLIFVLLKDREQAPAVAEAIASDGFTIVNFRDYNALLATFEEFSGAYMFVLYLIVLAITSTVIINTLIMAVFERTREIGILSSIGMRGGRIMAMFFTESALLAVGGILLGMLIGLPLVYYASTAGIYFGDVGAIGMPLSETIYAYLTWNDAITLTVMAFVISLLAAVYPAMLAAGMEPVDALRGGQ